MSLSTAFNVISSSFAANAAQTAVVSNNIANVNTPGYSREIANVVTNSYGGSDVASITREANAALLEQVSTSTSQAAAQQAISDGLTTLAQTVDDSSSATSTSGANQNGASPSAMLANLQSALTTYADSPSSSSAAGAVVSAASDLASSLNSASATVQQVRETADQKMASSVNTINSLLSQFTAANSAVVTGLQTGANVSSAEDTRNSIVTQLAHEIGVSTTVAANGSESIYTDSGVTLFQDTPRAVSFTPTPTLVDGADGGAVTVGGVPVTGANSPMPIQSGALAGYAAVRDTLAPEYQAQLDQIAGGLINAFGESDQSANPTAPSLPGLFTTPGETSLPSMAATTGLAAAIEINPNVDPSQGGNPNLLRDGGISDPGNPAYVYNTTGAASYTGRIQEPHRPDQRDAELRSIRRPRLIGQPHRLRQRFRELAASAEPAGERRLLLSERRRNSGDLGVVERDRRQSRRRDDQHAEPRKLLRFDGEAVDDRDQHVHSPAAGGMTTVGANFVSTSYLANSLVGPVMQAQSQLTNAMTEMSTGEYADLGLQLGDQSGYELSLKEQVGQLQTLTTGNSAVSTSLSTAQSALTAIQSNAKTTLNNLAAWTPSGTSGASLQNMGQSALQSLISGANTTSGDQYVFGGINSAVAPIADYYSTPASAAKTAVDQAFQTTFGVLPSDPAAANISASDMQSFLSGPFAALFQGASWSADWSSASSVNTSATIAPGQTVTTSTNANQPGFQELAQGYAMLSEFAGSALSSDAQQAVATAAASLVSQGVDSMINIQAGLGSSQSAVTSANNSMSSQLTILQGQLGNLDNVNSTATAAEISSLTNQIQMAYELTARLQQLNLAQYLPVA